MSGLSKSGTPTRRRYTDEFKRDAVGLVTDQEYPLAEAARSRGVHVSLIRNWKEKLVGNKEVIRDGELSESEKATTFFVKESQ